MGSCGLTRACKPPMRLAYHSDIQALDPMIACAEQGDEIEGRVIPSRRAIIYNLPPDTTPSQVLRCITSGQVISVDLIPRALTIGARDTRNAVVQFICSSQTKTWMDLVRSDPPILKSASGKGYEARIWPVPTSSYPVTPKTRYWAETGLTRTLTVGNVPTSTVWFMISAMRTVAKLAGVTHCSQSQSCTVQFTHLSAAGYFYSRFRQGLFDFLTENNDNDATCYCEPAQDASMTNPQYLVSTCDIIGHIPESILNECFNVSPFNEHWPTSHLYIMTLCGLQPSSTDVSSALSESSDGGQKWTADEDGEREMGDNHSWSLSADDDRKLRMTNTLHDPEWAKEWDTYFSASGLVNIRTWELYGAIAKHRRMVASELGLPEGTVPLCTTQCQQGCTNIRHAPPPELVKSYLTASDLEVF